MFPRHPWDSLMGKGGLGGKTRAGQGSMAGALREDIKVHCLGKFGNSVKIEVSQSTYK